MGWVTLSDFYRDKQQGTGHESSVKDFRKATSLCVLSQNVSTWYPGIPGQLSDDDVQAQS